MPKLTAAAVEKYRPAKDRREIPDAGSPGLYLIVQASGRKSWALRFRKPGGRSAKLTLGSVDLSGKEVADEPVIGAPLTLASARRLAAEVHRQRAMGRDVTAQRRRERLEREARGAATFDQAAIDFITKHAIRKTRRWQPQARLLGLRPKAQSDASQIELELIPKGLADRWRDRPIIEIDDDEIHRIVEDVIEKGVPGAERRSKKPTEPLARSMHATLSKLFGWLVEKKRIKSNPAANVHSPKAPKARERFLSDAEIAKFWTAAGTVGKRHEAIIKILLLTGCRRDEVVAMRRSELSDDGKTWTIPGARTKNHRDHAVWLAPMAREILSGVEPVGDLMFSTTGMTPVAGFSKLKHRLDGKMNLSKPWRLHDLRRTCATGMAEIGIAPHIVEACLNHISGAKAGVAGTYNRATYAAEKKAALERWASHVEGLVTGRKAKVVRMRGSAS